MADVLLIDHDPTALEAVERTLHTLGHVVWTTSSGRRHSSSSPTVAPTLSWWGAAIEGHARLRSAVHRPPPSELVSPVVVTACGKVSDVLSAIQLGAADFVGKPISEERLRSVLECALSRGHSAAPAEPDDNAVVPQPHAAARWANAVVPIIDCPDDPRTITAWGRCIAASPGAILELVLHRRCRSAKVAGLRLAAPAVVFSEGGRHKPENLLDVVDRRTLRAACCDSRASTGSIFSRPGPKSSCSVNPDQGCRDPPPGRAGAARAATPSQGVVLLSLIAAARSEWRIAGLNTGVGSVMVKSASE